MMDDNTINFMIQKNPLVLFSVYTAIHKQCLFDTGNEILILMQGFRPNRIDGTELNKVYGLIWLWCLGAFELIRTMEAHKAKNCFDAKTKSKLTKLKAKLAKIRTPFAKQELAGKNQYVATEPSISLFGEGDIGFTIDNKNYWFKELYNEFVDLFIHIKPENIKMRLEDSYGRS